MSENPELVFPCGKHEGETIEDVPAPYLRYIAANWEEVEFVEAAEAELQFRKDHGEGR